MLPASLMSLTLGYGPHWPSQAPDLDSISHPSAFLNPSPRACSSSSLWSLVDWSLPFYSLPAPSSPPAVLPSWGLGTSHCSDAWVGVLAFIWLLPLHPPCQSQPGRWHEPLYPLQMLQNRANGSRCWSACLTFPLSPRLHSDPFMHC